MPSIDTAEANSFSRRATKLAQYRKYCLGSSTAQLPRKVDRLVMDNNFSEKEWYLMENYLIDEKRNDFSCLSVRTKGKQRFLAEWRPQQDLSETKSGHRSHNVTFICTQLDQDQALY